MKRYSSAAAERKWQKTWEKEKQFFVPSAVKGKRKLYVLDMFPYPSGQGLHVGHVESYTASDIIARYYRMRDYAVLHPMGWDAFGLPAENYAIKTKTSPRIVVKKNVANFKRQINSLGFSYDWSREINTTDPEYYRWTQWIFLKLFKRGLAYQKEMPVNWCPSCKTVLADEEVVGGKCDRCGTPVERKNLTQWMLKITAYADRLLEDLDGIAWPEKVKTMQRNWIGRSEGVVIDFLPQGADRQAYARLSENKKIISKANPLRVFTTRPDTIYGATYLVVAPEHPLIEAVGNQLTNRREVDAYLRAARNKSDEERIAQGKEKTGVLLGGVWYINPATNKKIPVYVADYVLIHYGYGAIMAVPAHDERDFDFAKKHHLPVVPVVSPDGKTDSMVLPYTGNGVLIHSGSMDGKQAHDAAGDIVRMVDGKAHTQYKMRDWVFSRQRYWGEPIPLVFCQHCADKIKNPSPTGGQEKSKIKNLSKGEALNPGWVPLDEKDLPLTLPNVKRYEPTGTLQSPLSAVPGWVHTRCPRCGGPARRETDTMPQWAGSCWYYLRYIDPKNRHALIDPKKEKEWIPVSVYIGGVEHAVLHLLYARFWHKVLYDEKIVHAPEPFYRLVNQGIVLGSDGEKMSKSRGNVVNPDDIVKKYGADALRMYEMFMGPLEDAKPWDEKGIIGIVRFLERIWAMGQQFAKKTGRKKPAPNQEFTGALHRTIKKVTQDIEAFRFNTAISALMILSRRMDETLDSVPLRAFETFLALVFPFAPFMTEEIWRGVLKNKKSLGRHAWPVYAERYIAQEMVAIAVQVNGKMRGTITVPANASRDDALAAVSADPRLAPHISGKVVTRVVFVPDRIINIMCG